jgi:hypothetical protein
LVPQEFAIFLPVTLNETGDVRENVWSKIAQLIDHLLPLIAV